MKRVVVNLRPNVEGDLEELVRLTGSNTTDLVNTAIPALLAIVEGSKDPMGRLTFTRADGVTCVVFLR
jgi:hypothetical protein